MEVQDDQKKFLRLQVILSHNMPDVYGQQSSPQIRIMLDFDMAFIRFYNRKYQGSKTPWCCRAKVLSGYSKPKGGLMKPMKKPVRLLGMVFQVDK